jgi:hypothetical protein
VSSTATEARRAGLGHGQVERPQLLAEQDRDLAGDAPHGQDVAPVGGGLDLQHAVAQVDRLDHVGPDRGVGRQHQDPGVVVEHAQLAGGGEHAVGEGAADLAAADLDPSGQLGPGGGPGHDVAGGEVAGAADDRALLTAGVDPDQDEPVGVGVLGHLEDPGGEDAGQVVADPVDGLDLDAGEGQPLGQRAGGDVDVDVVGQPGERDAHLLLLSRRWSASGRRCRSGCACRPGPSGA